MTFCEFYRQIRAAGGNFQDAVRLDREGQESAEDAHAEMWEAGELEPEVPRNNRAEFIRFCRDIGRDFVLENLGDDGIFRVDGGDNGQT